MKSILLSALLASSTLASPQIFRNEPDVPVLLQMDSYGACVPTFTGNYFYPTLAAASQSQATGPSMRFYQNCTVSPLMAVTR